MAAAIGGNELWHYKGSNGLHGDPHASIIAIMKQPKTTE